MKGIYVKSEMLKVKCTMLSVYDLLADVSLFTFNVSLAMRDMNIKNMNIRDRN